MGEKLVPERPVKEQKRRKDHTLIILSHRRLLLGKELAILARLNHIEVNNHIAPRWLATRFD